MDVVLREGYAITFCAKLKAVVFHDNFYLMASANSTNIATTKLVPNLQIEVVAWSARRISTAVFSVF
jgi:hypothetical protein